MADRMRIAYILHRFPYVTETFVAREMEELAALGHDVRVFSLLKPNYGIVPEAAQAFVARTAYPAPAEVIRSQFHWLATHPVRYVKALGRAISVSLTEPRVLARVLATFPAAVMFARRIADEKCDHIHAEFVWIDAAAAWVVSTLTGIPFTVHPHAFGLFGRKQSNVRRQLEAADAVVAISEFHAHYISRLCPGLDPEAIHLVRCGIDPDRFSPHPNGDSGARGPIQILSIGRGVEKKGHRYLLEACVELKRRGVDFECRIVAGDVPEVGDLARSLDLGDRVTVHGNIGEAEVFQLFEAADVFALACVVAQSGDRDGIPIVLMEAMAMEIPVVTTPVGGIADLVVDGATGCMVPERDSLALADAIERLSKSSDLRQELGRGGRKHVEAFFDNRRNIVGLEAMMLQVSGGAVPPAANPSRPGRNP